ncbi:NmrA-like family protein [Neofusicoccum parvum]|uniref:NmrA-like family protein n=1 Tax=Neofusicoccum parvum TaxID=310453 RepID=A0ACB5SBF4_9PEZI|nr:NmrA-like family protein [Neofusicoccum parvum]
MTTVAIAGGTGNIGRTLVEVLSENPKNTGSTATTDAKATIVHIDYGDVESISQALEKHQIDTVISCISMIDESSGESELNLIRAADTSSATRQFIPNDWGVPLPESQISAFPIFKYQKAAIELLQKSKLQWTVFYIGYIMDYFGVPHINTRMVGPPVFVDVANNVAALPGTGNEPIVLTYSFDLARARGTKFDVSYDSFETLGAGSVTELPCYKAVYSFYPKEQLEYFLAMVGRGMVSGTKEMLEKAWKRE